jgi:prepilin-type N-terminal cleavage/methylation domain-containing protein
MQRVSDGYTLIEVMIVLAISVVLVGVSLTFLSGREGHTRFSQNMRDIQSKLQSWLDNVPNGFTNVSAGSANCYLFGSSVKIDGGNQNPDAQCIFLGKAIQFRDDPATSVYAYSVFGQRLNGTDLVSTIKDVGPVPAVGTNGTGNLDLTETYALGPGTTVRRIVKSSGIGSDNGHMAGFYLSLNTDEAVGKNGNSNLKSYQYPLGDFANSSSEVVGCIENKSPCPLLGFNTEPAPLTDWEICFKNDSNADTALLTVRSSLGLGATTQLEFKSC